VQADHPHLVAASLESADAVGLRAPIFIAPTLAARLAGVSRSTIYRHWPTPLALNDDLMVEAVVHRPGWQQAAVADPTVPLADALRPYLANPARDLGVVARCGAIQAVHTFPSGPLALAAEGRWRVALADRLGAELARRARSPRPGTSVATIADAIAAVVEGALLLDAVRRGPAHRGWTEADGDVVLDAVDRVIGTATVPDGHSPGTGRHGTGSRDPGTRAAATPGAATPPHRPEATRRLAARVVEAFAALTAADREVVPALRLVDAEDVAERAGVTGRWVFQAWPTTAHHNGDLIAAILRRHQDRCTALAHELAGRYLDEGRPVDADDLHRLLADSVRAGSDPLRAGFANTVVSTRDPLMRARSAACYDRWLRLYQVELLVVLGGLGRTADPEVGAATATRLVAGALLGASRMSLAERAVDASHDRADGWADALVVVVDALTRPMG
jgi:AcrR family transcriptional regulator